MTISEHAVDRFRERFACAARLTREDARRELAAILPLASEIPKPDRLRAAAAKLLVAQTQATGVIVLVVSWGGVVKTVLDPSNARGQGIRIPQGTRNAKRGSNSA